jgi:hypothetical protein
VAGVLSVFIYFSRKAFYGMNLPDFSHQSIANILARALELGETRQLPVTGGVNGSAEN